MNKKKLKVLKCNTNKLEESLLNEEAEKHKNWSNLHNKLLTP